MSQLGLNNNTEVSNQSDSLSILCREVRNLLRSKPNCMIPFSKFVPAYHNHYGRQCCVYQYGHTKLIELLESIPHVVQIIGDGTQRYITLTYREQIKRFASDLIKVVKAQPGKKLKLSQFARAYEQVLGRIFRVEDYGTNDINVLLAEIWEGTINIIPIKRELVDQTLVTGPLFVCASNVTCVTASNNGPPVNKPYITEHYPDAWFEIPKRERSEKEIKRTKYFIWDVIELLSTMKPEFSVQFSKFIPSYHYYFNRQCKVSIFGFSKLIDLFESISPDVVEIVDVGAGEEKVIKLSKKHWPTVSMDSAEDHTGGESEEDEDEEIEEELSVDEEEDDNDVEDDDDDDDEDDDDDDDVDDDDVEEEEEYADDDQAECYDDGYNDDLGDDDGDDLGDDKIMPAQAIDCGPTEEELLELEDELKAYEELKAIQSKRSTRMAAILDIFKYSIY